jgi:hypothetical protein
MANAEDPRRVLADHNEKDQRGRSAGSRRGGTAVPDRSDGRSGLLSQVGHHPSGTGRAVFVLLLEEPDRRHPRMCHNFKSGRISQRFRTYWRPTPTRWTLQDDKNIITVWRYPTDARDGIGLLTGVCIDDQHAAGAVVGHFVGHASEHKTLDSAGSLVANHENVGVKSFGGFNECIRRV